MIQTIIYKSMEIDNEEEMVEIIELKRTFETINKKRLLEKLYQCGIKEICIFLEWLKSYTGYSILNC